MSFPKTGKFFPNGKDRGAGGPPTGSRFSSEIAAALKISLGSTHAAIKTAASWTGANERTAKNWFAGKYSPSGEHLAALALHSDEVLNTFLARAGRQNLITAAKFVYAEEAISDLLTAIRNLKEIQNR